jgi:hypothetical protein
MNTLLARPPGWRHKKSHQQTTGGDDKAAGLFAIFVYLTLAILVAVVKQMVLFTKLK